MTKGNAARYPEIRSPRLVQTQHACRKDGPLRVQLLRQHHIALPKYRALGMACPCEGAKPPERELLERFAAQLKENGMEATFFG